MVAAGGCLSVLLAILSIPLLFFGLSSAEIEGVEPQITAMAVTAEAASPTGIAVVIENGEAVIFPAALAEAQGVGLWLNSEFSDYWTPQAADVLAFEAGLAEFLENSGNTMLEFGNETPVWERLDRYQRQYIGLVVDGQQVVYGNFFCGGNTHFDDWRGHFVTVMDGGNCFFSLAYDPQTGEYQHLMVNGVA